MKVIAFGTLKGGTGKTTLTFNLAGVLAQRGKKVCGIDLDFQSNLSNNAGIDISNPDAYSSRDIFESQYSNPENLVVQHPISVLPTFDIIPGTFLLTKTDNIISSRGARERILLNYIEEHKLFFEQYDYVFIDTHPGMGNINQNAFLAADSVVMVTDIDDNSLNGLQMFLFLWGEYRKDLRKEDNVHAVIINKANLTRGLTDEVLKYCQEDEDIAPILVPQMIRDKAVFPDSAAERVPVMFYNHPNKRKPVSEATEELNNVVDYLIERGVF